MSHADALLSVIAARRIAQARKWGDEHDEKHTRGDWNDLVVKYMDRFVDEADFEAQQMALIDAGALVLSAFEALRRLHDRGQQMERLT